MSLRIKGLEIQDEEGRPLLGPLSLALAPGHRVGLAGPSGAGKSLLVRAVFQVLPTGLRQQAGRIEAWGRSLDSGAPDLDRIRGRRLGWVPQDPLVALNPHLEVRDHLALLPMAQLGDSRAAALRRLDPWLDRLRLPTNGAFLRRKPHELSGGQRQRLCLAMALSTEPELLILDEPTTALDPLLQAEFLELMLGLQRERPFGWLWISHDLEVLAATCTELHHLERGQLVASGPLPACSQSRAIPAPPPSSQALEESRPA